MWHHSTYNKSDAIAMKLPAISKTGPLTNFWTPIPAKINIETIIIMINNV